MGFLPTPNFQVPAVQLQVNPAMSSVWSSDKSSGLGFRPHSCVTPFPTSVVWSWIRPLRYAYPMFVSLRRFKFVWLILQQPRDTDIADSRTGRLEAAAQGCEVTSALTSTSTVPLRLSSQSELIGSLLAIAMQQPTLYHLDFSYAHQLQYENSPNLPSTARFARVLLLHCLPIFASPAAQ
jgi:hypothetical protein